jgi:hypothetical protein
LARAIGVEVMAGSATPKIKIAVLVHCHPNSMFHSLQFDSGDKVLQGVDVAYFVGAQDERLGLLVIAFAQSVLAREE